MDSSVATVIVGAVSATGAFLAGFWSNKASKRSTAVHEKATVLEGYDELLTHFRVRVGELEEQLSAMLEKVKQAREELDRSKTSLTAARLDYVALRKSAIQAAREAGREDPLPLVPIDSIRDEWIRRLESGELD